MRNIEDLQLFVMIARAGGLTAAEAETGLPRSALSRRLRALESGCGVQLAKRSPRSFGLTPAGQALFDDCAAAFDRIEGAKRKLSETRVSAVGLVRVTAPPALANGFLIDVLPAFLDKHPAISVALDVTGQKHDLEATSFDLAFRVGPIGSDRSVVRTLMTTRESIYAQPGFDEMVSVPADLAGRPAVACRRDLLSGSEVIWHLTDGMTETSVRLQARTVVHDATLAVQLAARGVGLVSLPRFVAEPAAAAGRLRRVLPGWASPPIVVRAVLPHKPTAAARELLEFLCTEAKRRMPDEADL